MKVRIEVDDYYPFHEVVDSKSHGVDCEVPMPTVERWREVQVKFDEMQREMKIARQTALKDAEQKLRDNRRERHGTR